MAKVLVGVYHEQDYLEAFVKQLWKDLPSFETIGLELPLNHERLYTIFAEEVGFFSPIYREMKEAGKTVYALEDPGLFNETQELSPAFNWVEGKITEKLLRRAFTEAERERKTLSPFTAPIARHHTLVKYKIIARSIEALEQGEDYVNQTWFDVNRKREEFMLPRIQELKPDVIIVGTAHARALEPSLPEYQLRVYEP